MEARHRQYYRDRQTLKQNWTEELDSLNIATASIRQTCAINRVTGALAPVTVFPKTSQESDDDDDHGD